jgi:hypothetical protein
MGNRVDEIWPIEGVEVELVHPGGLKPATWAKFVTGRMPGTSGTLIPAARHLSRNLR